MTQIENGKTSLHHYCEECADEAGLNFQIDLGQEVDEGAFAQEQEEELSCTKCGTTLEQFEETLQAGCASCYTVFSDTLQEQQHSYTGNRYYQGKQYRAANSRSFKSQLGYLKQELSDAVKQQKFELASVLRDRIRELEAQVPRP